MNSRLQVLLTSFVSSKDKETDFEEAEFMECDYKRSYSHGSQTFKKILLGRPFTILSITDGLL